MSEQDKESTALDIVNWALKVPGVKVNRESFLIETLNISKENTALLLEKGPIGSGLFTAEEIKKIAEKISSKRKLQSTGTSFTAGLPGGLAMAATIPADTAQFFGFSLRLAQEIAYLYDTPDFWDGELLDDNRVKTELMLYLGTMLGVGGAASAMRLVTQAFGKQLAKDLTKQALTKTFWYPMLKTLGKYVGVKITKDTVARGASKVVPLLGGLVSGGLTYYTMSKMNERLIKAFEVGVVYTESEKIADEEILKQEMPEIYEAMFEEIQEDVLETKG
ncbi:hypothetical protein A1D22_02705 [Pasteurellaceae bacterium LFhippo2]|nr:hypothetical protein [Pasteurellaceae bacterium LFhippo2]